MKILEMPSYYVPEQMSSTAMHNDLETSFCNAGFQLEIIAPMPTRGVSDEVRKQYKKRREETKYDGKIKVYRFPMSREGKNWILRALRYVRVLFKQYRLGKKAQGIDVIFGVSTPPIQGLLCSRLAKKLSKKYKRKVKFVYNLQDIFPDSLVTTGIAKKDSLLWKIGRKIEDYTYKNADKIIVINESGKKNIVAKGVPEEKIVVVSNWIDASAIKPIPKEENPLFEEFGILRDKFTVVYAGNFGKAQGANVVLEAAERFKDNRDVQFVIFGGGSEFENAKNQAAKLDNVFINGLLPQERVSEVYSLGDVAIITCKKGVGNSGMPSKTWSIMACNTPIIAAFDKDSDLSAVIDKANAGIMVEPENVDELVVAIQAMLNGKFGSFAEGREYTLQNASKEVCTAKYVDVIRE